MKSHKHRVEGGRTDIAKLRQEKYWQIVYREVTAHQCKVSATGSKL